MKKCIKSKLNCALLKKGLRFHKENKEKHYRILKIKIIKKIQKNEENNLLSEK